MLKTARSDEFSQVAGRLRGSMMNQLWQWHSRDFCPAESWTPPVNFYHLERRLEVCFDLAGVDKTSIDLRVEPGRLVVRGVRQAAEPPRHDEEVMRIIAMEIDHGPFCRIIPLPAQVDLPRVTSEYERGYLWVRMPLRDPA